jgi:hypothetical protein
VNLAFGGCAIITSKGEWMRSFLLVARIALLPTHAFSQWAKDGHPVPDAPNRKSKDGFGAHLLVISHFPEFIKEWTTSPPEHAPHVSAVSKVKSGEPVAIVIFFAGCKGDKAGHCNGVYDLTIVRPDGSTMHKFSDLDLWKMEPPPNVQLGLAIPQIQFDSTDPRGMYRIKATVRDKNQKVALELETTLDVE